MRSLLTKLIRDENGSEVIDYTLVVGLIVVACLAMVGKLGDKIVLRWTALRDAL